LRSGVLSASTPPGEAGALDGLGAQIVEALDAQFPGAEVEHQEVPFVDVGRG
jgi:hypothetical protein